MAKKTIRKAASSAPAKRPRASARPTKEAASEPLTKRELRELEALAAKPDSAIDLSDAPELADWSGARRGLFYRPVKQQLTLRLDADVIAWFKAHTPDGAGYQTHINDALRAYTSRRARAKRG